MDFAAAAGVALTHCEVEPVVQQRDRQPAEASHHQRHEPLAQAAAAAAALARGGGAVAGWNLRGVENRWGEWG